MGFYGIYPLVNQDHIENGHVEWENSLLRHFNGDVELSEGNYGTWPFVLDFPVKDGDFP